MKQFEKTRRRPVGDLPLDRVAALDHCHQAALDQLAENTARIDAAEAVNLRLGRRLPIGHEGQNIQGDRGQSDLACGSEEFLADRLKARPEPQDIAVSLRFDKAGTLFSTIRTRGGGVDNADFSRCMTKSS